MRHELSLMSWLLLVPLALGMGVANVAAQQPAPQTPQQPAPQTSPQPAPQTPPLPAPHFNFVLANGSTMTGAISFIINLDTPYGQIKIPSNSMVSARFDATSDWADIRLNEAELKLKYDPASSNILVTMSAGPFDVKLANVSTIDNGRVAPPAVAAKPAAPPAPAYAQPPEPTYVQPPPTVVYQYTPPPTYYYEPPAYYPPDYYTPDYYYGAPYVYPGLGFGVVIGGFGGGFHEGFHGDFHEGFHGGFGGGGFHGGLGGGGFHGSFGGGHR